MKKNESSTYNSIYAVVRKIPFGKVASYGQIAALAGLPRQARLVGYAMHNLTPDDDVPWWRVINSQGRISFSPDRNGGDDLQRTALESEGVEFSASGKINLEKFRWEPKMPTGIGRR